MADLTLDTVTDTARDAFYVAVGAGVIAFQKLQVQRVELTKTLTAQLADAKGILDSYAMLGEIAKHTPHSKAIAERARSAGVSKVVFDRGGFLYHGRVRALAEGAREGGLEERFEAVLAQIEAQLPEQARDLVKQARELVGRAA